jgi:hypothetical protein
MGMMRTGAGATAESAKTEMTKAATKMEETVALEATTSMDTVGMKVMVAETAHLHATHPTSLPTVGYVHTASGMSK